MALYPSSASTYRSYAVANSGNIKPTEGILLSLSVCNLSTQTRYLLLYSTSIFTALAPIREIVPVYATSGYTILDSGFFTVLGESYPLGISWAFSTSPTAFVAAETNSCLLKVRYL